MEKQKRINEALEYLYKLDMEELQPGRYDINENIFYNVLEYESKPFEECHIEAHKKYADIQWIIQGEECIDIVPFDGLEVDEAYDSEKDIGFYKDASLMSRTHLTAGSYIVLPPHLAHKPGIAPKKPAPVKKLVCKVKMV